ncbi:MAG: PH domain-containing protein [Candidatus Eiseniibacteriota bacterium]
MTSVPLEWSFNPWRERPLAAIAAALMTLGMCLLIASLGEPPLVRVILGIAVLGTLSPVLSPARCRVDDEGVAMRGPFGTARRRWSDLKRVAARPAGVMVSPYARPHWLDPFRGLLLPMPERERETLLDELRGRLDAHGL